MILLKEPILKHKKSVKIRAHPWLKNVIRWEQNCLNPFATGCGSFALNSRSILLSLRIDYRGRRLGSTLPGSAIGAAIIYSHENCVAHRALNKQHII